MGRLDPLTFAKALALLLPAALLAGAYGSQVWGGLVPCEMCYWQRWPHWAAAGFALAAILLGRMPDRGRSFVWLAALAILVSGAIALYHVGVQEGVFTRACNPPNAATLEDMMAIRYAPCNDKGWVDPVIGLSMAAWNAILSVSGALVIAWLSLKRPPAALA